MWMSIAPVPAAAVFTGHHLVVIAVGFDGRNGANGAQAVVVVSPRIRSSGCAPTFKYCVNAMPRGVVTYRHPIKCARAPRRQFSTRGVLLYRYVVGCRRRGWRWPGGWLCPHPRSSGYESSREEERRRSSEGRIG